MALEFKPAWLFVPGDRPDRYMKAAERSDIVILDLEELVVNSVRLPSGAFVVLLNPSRGSGTKGR